MAKSVVRHRAYFWLGAIFVTSAIVAFIAPHGDFLQQFASVPLVGSLVGMLVKILLDEVAYQRELSKLEIAHQYEMFKVSSQNHFSLATTSHMANVAFDKHVEFSEKYATATHDALVVLFRHGPTDEVLNSATDLFLIRREFAVWLTSGIEGRLDAFEGALRSIGANAGLVRAVNDGTIQAHINEMYLVFAEVMGWGRWQDKEITGDRAINKVIQHLRGILGTEELTTLRQALTTKAFAQLNLDAQ